MKYSVSFATGGILYNEFESILPLIFEKDRDQLLAEEVIRNQYIKINSEAARKRIINEIKKRINSVDDFFWKNYKLLNKEQKKLMLFYLCVKTYRLVQDFHLNITVNNYWTYQTQIDVNQYKMYLDELSSKEPSIEKWAESTKKKSITNYIRALKESGFSNNNKLQTPEAESHFYCYFLKNDAPWAMDIFLLNNQQKETITNYCK